MAFRLNVGFGDAARLNAVRDADVMQVIYCRIISLRVYGIPGSEINAGAGAGVHAVAGEEIVLVDKQNGFRSMRDD